MGSDGTHCMLTVCLHACVTFHVLQWHVLECTRITHANHCDRNESHQSYSLSLCVSHHTATGRPNTQTLPLLSDPTMSSLFTRYLSVGEKIFDTGASYASHSSYFKQVDPAIAVRSGLEKSAKAGWDRLMQGEHHDDQNNNKEKDSSGKSWWGK